MQSRRSQPRHNHPWNVPLLGSTGALYIGLHYAIHGPSRLVHNAIPELGHHGVDFSIKLVPIDGGYPRLARGLGKLGVLLPPTCMVYNYV